ncbi:MAG: TPM domain-containing protein, partial [Thiogranum sp.]|nr:TPM domain-containing protein [Thiogranum sp.]
MPFLNDADRRRIRSAIEAAERRTRGEFVTVIAREADDYLYIPLLWAALIALLIPAVTHFIDQPWLAAHSYMVQIAGFVLLAVLFRWPLIKHRLIPGTVQHQRAHRIALEQFLLQNLHDTQERTGVLLFVSRAEHYVEIIADKGINDRVAPGTWDALVEDFVAHVKQGKVADGFVSTIEACGDLLETHFPAAEGDR